MRSILLFVPAILFFSTLSFAQTPQKQVAAVRTTFPIKLDGSINEEAWKSAALINELIEMRPSFGKKEDAGQKQQ